MTQLMGRILRLPHVAKTGRAALDACYVLCHDAKTGEVIKAIKQSLETEGMRDLALSVQGGDNTVAKPVAFKRRTEFRQLRIFLPRVTWVESDGLGRKRRRELAYDSDILSQVDWSALQTGALAQDWAPAAQGELYAQSRQLEVGLEVLDHPELVRSQLALTAPAALDRARLVRGLLDIEPNAWWV